MGSQGVLVVISGFSGVVKGTLINLLLQQYDRYALSISATTRDPRPAEENGKDYFFLTREEFEERIRAGRLIEYAEYCGNYYGTPRDYVEQQLEKGLDVILEIEVQGAMKIRKMFPEALLIFIMPPDAQTLVNRLYGRGSEEKEAIRARLNRAVKESEGIEAYDDIIVNDDLDVAVRELHQLIQSQHALTGRNLPFIKKTQQEICEVTRKYEESIKTAH